MQIKSQKTNSITKWHEFVIEHLDKSYKFEVKTTQTDDDFRIVEIHGEPMNKKLKSEIKQLIISELKRGYDLSVFVEKITNNQNDF